MCFWKDESPKISNLTKKEKKIDGFFGKKMPSSKNSIPAN